MQALLDQHKKEKAAIERDFYNRMQQQKRTNAELKQESGKRDEEHKVLKRRFEQYKMEATNKLKVTSLTICNVDHLLRVTLHVKQATHCSFFCSPSCITPLLMQAAASASFDCYDCQHIGHLPRLQVLAKM